MSNNDPSKPHHRVLNGHLWANTGRMAVSFLCGIAVAAFVFGGKSQQFIDLLNWRTAAEVQLKVIQKQADNNEYDIKTEFKDIAALDTRVKKTEEQTGKLDTVIFELHALTKAFEDFKNQKR